jgi:hypothetical protein
MIFKMQSNLVIPSALSSLYCRHTLTVARPARSSLSTIEIYVTLKAFSPQLRPCSTAAP